MSSRVLRYLALTCASWGVRRDLYPSLPVGLVEGALDEKDALWAAMTPAEREEVRHRVYAVIRHEGLL